MANLVKNIWKPYYNFIKFRSSLNSDALLCRLLLLYLWILMCFGVFNVWKLYISVSCSIIIFVYLVIINSKTFFFKIILFVRAEGPYWYRWQVSHSLSQTDCILLLEFFLLSFVSMASNLFFVFLHWYYKIFIVIMSGDF